MLRHSRRLWRPPVWTLYLISLGGLFLSLLLSYCNYLTLAKEISEGSCLIGSFLLSYYSLTLPRWDIVSFSAPIFSLSIFLLPHETAPPLFIGFLFAVTMCLLTLRLQWRFTTASDHEGDHDLLERYLTDYSEEIRTRFPAISEEIGAELTSLFMNFKYGEYDSVIEISSSLLHQISDERASERALRKALTIMREISESDVNVEDNLLDFSDDERDFVAVRGMKSETHIFALDNALILIYALALASSPQNTDRLAEQRDFIIRLLDSHKNSLSLSERSLMV